MKSHRRLRRVAMSFLAAGFLIMSTGCDYRYWMSQVTSFTAGWLVRDVTMPTTTDTQCFRNGVEIDCSELQ